MVSREALRPMAEVRLESDLRRVLRLLAARSCAELVIADLARDAELSRETTANYVALLEALYLVTLIPPWATSATTRAKRRPKITLVDTGLAADLVGVGEATFAPSADGVLAGALFETLVVTEVFKQASWSQRPVEVSHFRDRDGAEIDLVVEDRRSGAVAGIAVKLTSTPLARHARHLARMRERLGARFSVGLVIHAGRVTLPLGGRAVGCTAYWDPRFWPGSSELCGIEIGWTWLAASAQRTGMNVEAKLLLFEYAFESLGMVRVDLKTDARNQQSRRSIEDLGARFEGVLRRWSQSHAPREEGLLRDSAMFSVIAAEWPATKATLRRRLARSAAAHP